MLWSQVFFEESALAPWSSQQLSGTEKTVHSDSVASVVKGVSWRSHNVSLKPTVSGWIPLIRLDTHEKKELVSSQLHSTSSDILPFISFLFNTTLSLNSPTEVNQASPNSGFNNPVSHCLAHQHRNVLFEQLFTFLYF